MGRFDAKSITILVLLVLLAGVVVYMTTSMTDFASSNQDRQIAVIERAIDSALLQCYALEGSYPPNLQYLSEHYGVMLYEDQYEYLYDVFASNVRPNVIVTPKLR